MRTIKTKILPRLDFRLGRIVEHDSKSLEFGFDTTGLSIVDVTHERYIPILDQGQVGSCTGNAGIGAISSAPFLNQDNLTYSRDERGALKLYSDNEVLDGYPPYPQTDRGSSGLSCAKNLLKAGIISSYQHTFTLNDALKALTQYPIIVGIHWYNDMFHPDADGRVHPTGALAGGHEIQAYKIDTENGRIFFHNSWGTSWSVQGDFYLTWEDFASLLAQDGDVVVLIPPTITPPTPIVKVSILKVGSRGDDVKKLQTLLGIAADGIFGAQTKMAVISFQEAHGLVPDGIVGKATWAALNGTPNPKQAIIDIITQVCNQNGIEPLLGVSVATCESGLDPHSTLWNPPSKSTDRGLFQWNNVYHNEITDAQAFDPAIATQLFCTAVKNGHLHEYWSASQYCWKKKLTPEIISKYQIT